MKKRVLLVCLMVCLGFDVFTETINLEQARTLALAHSRSLAGYNMAIRNSILEERSQLYLMLPSLSAIYNVDMNYLNNNWGFVNPSDTISTGLAFSVTQILFNGGKSFIQKAINAINTESVRNDALAEYFNVLDSADNAYYAVLEAMASLEAAESSLQTATASLAIADIRQAGGMINQGDYLRALADKEAQENSRNQARRNLVLNRTKFNALTGLSGTADLAPIDFDVYEQILKRLDGMADEEFDALYRAMWDIMMQTNPSIKRAALTNKISEKNLSIAKRDYLPTITATVFSGGLQYSPSTGFKRSLEGGLSLRGNIPIDFWTMANQIERNKIARDSAALNYLDAEASLETELQSTLINTIAQAESVLSSRRTQEYTEKHFEYVMERYRLSQSSVSELGEASSLLITSRNNYITATYGFLQSLSKLRLLGAIDDEEKLARLLLGNDE
jgi:outer membrane protein TolC